MSMLLKNKKKQVKMQMKTHNNTNEKRYDDDDDDGHDDGDGADDVRPCPIRAQLPCKSPRLAVTSAMPGKTCR